MSKKKSNNNRPTPTNDSLASASQTELQSSVPDADDETHIDDAPADPSRQLISIGEKFGRYEIKKELGRGAMGVVYLAHDTNLDRLVALKIPSFKKQGQQAVDRFYREARSMATISHPNLCPVYDVGDSNGVHYLTMQFIEGRPLSDYLKGGKSHSPKQTAAVIRKLALALEEAHQAGIVHRDLKPANIMINPRNEPVIMDFGLAQRRSKNETSLTHEGQFLGTPLYMSPEQAKSKQDLVGPRSDIYALGVICYQLLTGQTPFTGSLGEVMAGILSEEPIPPSQVGDNKIDQSIEAICLQAMSKRIEDRYESAAKLAGALKDYMQGRRLKSNESLNAPSDSAESIEPSGTVYDSAQEAELADDFFSDLLTAENAATTLPSLVPETPPQAAFGGAFDGLGSHGWKWIAGGVAGVVLLFLVIAVISNLGRPNNEPDPPDQNPPTITANITDPLKNTSGDGAPHETDFASTRVGDPPANNGQKHTQLEIVESNDWEWSEPINLGSKVNTDQDELSPNLTTNDRMLWFVRGYHHPEDKAWVLQRLAIGDAWLGPKSVGRFVDFDRPIADLSISQDALRLVFVTWDEANSQRIRQATRSGATSPWSQPQLLEEAGEKSQFPVLSSDGLTLYCTKLSNICTRTRTSVSSSWSEPVSLSDKVDSDSDDRVSWVSPDERILIFHSDRGNADYQYDLWMITRDSKSSPWKWPFTLGAQVNSSQSESGGCLSANGKELYFASQRTGGYGQSDLYVSRRVPKK